MFQTIPCRTDYLEYIFPDNLLKLMSINEPTCITYSIPECHIPRTTDWSFQRQVLKVFSCISQNRCWIKPHHAGVVRTGSRSSMLVPVGGGGIFLVSTSILGTVDLLGAGKLASLLTSFVNLQVLSLMRWGLTTSPLTWVDWKSLFGARPSKRYKCCVADILTRSYAW